MRSAASRESTPSWLFWSSISRTSELRICSLILSSLNAMGRYLVQIQGSAIPPIATNKTKRTAGSRPHFLDPFGSRLGVRVVPCFSPRMVPETERQVQALVHLLMGTPNSGRHLPGPARPLREGSKYPRSLEGPCLRCSHPSGRGLWFIERGGETIAGGLTVGVGEHVGRRIALSDSR